MKNENKTSKVLLVLIAVLVVVAMMNQYVIMTSPTGLATYQPLNLVDYSEEGYQQLLRYDSTIRLNQAQMRNYVGLDVEMPCCGFQTLQAKGNCGCGHHIALSGLAKLMASQGYSKAEIQGEIDNWKNVFYPGSGSGVGAGSMGSC